MFAFATQWASRRSPSSGKIRRDVLSNRPRVEALEDRTVPAALFVDIGLHLETHPDVQTNLASIHEDSVMEVDAGVEMTMPEEGALPVISGSVETDDAHAAGLTAAVLGNGGSLEAGGETDTRLARSVNVGRTAERVIDTAQDVRERASRIVRVDEAFSLIRDGLERFF